MTVSTVVPPEPAQAAIRERLLEFTGAAPPACLDGGEVAGIDNGFNGNGSQVRPAGERPAGSGLGAGPLPNVAYLLPGLPPEGSGGSHSLVQEARGMRRLGAHARVCVPHSSLATATAVYANDDQLFAPYPDDFIGAGGGSPAALAGMHAAIGDANVVVATEYPSVDLLAVLARHRPQLLCAYYVQDYEPLFAPAQSSRADRALLSYRSLPELLLFAKTRWLCDVLHAAHGVQVAKVAPSLDRELFHAGGRSPWTGTLRVTAMIRPRTPRRRPRATLLALAAIARALGDGVHILTFGCEHDSLHQLRADGDGDGDVSEIVGHTHLGLLSRMQVAALMRRTDIFIDGSAYQAFGRTGLEAMACGAVPLLPRLGGVHEYARDDRNAVILAAGTPAEITAAVLALEHDTARLLRLSEAGIRAARSYSIERAARSQLLLFAAALAARGAALS
jgi:hypothetical protein